MKKQENTEAERIKDPICVILVWLGTLAFLCCVAGEAQAEPGAARALLNANSERLQLCVTALGLWSLAALSAKVHGRRERESG